MPPSFRNTRASLLALAASAFVAFGCDVRPAIVQVQPGAIRKDVFTSGEWHVQQTVIDSQYSMSYTFVGEQGDMDRIEWEITEDFLIARRSYEFIAGAEPSGIAAESEEGAVIAIYGIDSHFDIRRAYNPITGEELNVVTENTTDRPWFDRDYMRVDWSENRVTDWSFLLGARIFDGIQTEPVQYEVSDPSHPHHPRFESVDADGNWSEHTIATPIDGDDDISYIDIVNRMMVRPTEAHIPGFGDVPTCFLIGQGHLDCAPGEITVRHSFLRVDEDSRDYQPMLYTGDRMERFGYFITERAGYDRDYGVIEGSRYRFVNRHNLWQQSHRRDGAGELMRCTTDAACDDGQGSVCDLDLARAYRRVDAEGHLEGACTIPYRQREVRPIAYHLSANFPEDLLTAAQDLINEWNETFVGTVASLRELECIESGGEPGPCAGERMRDDHSQMFVMCHNPVIDADHDACGPVGTSAQPGDLRYSLLGWVSDAHASSPLGYGPSSADPLTGELIMGNAFVYGAAMQTLSIYARDIIRLLNGELEESDIIDGVHVQEWVDRMIAGEEVTGHTATDHAIELDAEDLEDVAEAMRSSYERAAEGRRPHAPPSSPAEFFEMAHEAEDRLWRGGQLGSTAPIAQARIESLQGTDIERMMTGPEAFLMAGIDPNGPIDRDAIAAASPLQGMSLQRQRAIQRARDMMQADQCVLNGDFADEGLLSLARRIQRAASVGDGTITWYGVAYNLRDADGAIDYDLVGRMLRQPIFHAVTAHEVGHTIGLRHNFSGSFDAVNYLPEYWNLRDDGTMLPRAWDPITPAEMDGGILEYQYSTVMDYGVNFVVTDAEGVGHYDHAAVKMGYGDLVEVFANAPAGSDATWINIIQGLGWPIPLTLESFSGGEPSAFRYTDWPEVLGGVENLQNRADVRYTSLRADPSLALSGLRDPVVDAEGRPAVPYLMCSDEQADLNPDCLRYDQGADVYETVQSVIDNYWFYYIFNSFARQRLGFTTSGLAGRVHDRYFEKLQRANQIYALYRRLFDDIFGDSPGYDRFYTRSDGMGAWTLTVGAAFQLLTRVVTAPEPDTYTEFVRADGTPALRVAEFGEPVNLRVDSVDGRFLETTWNFDAGYFWFDQLDRVGYFYDKTIALEILVDPTTYFLGRDTDADIRQYQLNFGSSFGPALGAFVSGIVAEDWSAIAPRSMGGRMVWPTATEMTSGSMGGRPIDPNASFSIQLYGAVYGMAFLPQTYDQTFLNRSRIFVRGGAEEITLAPGQPVVEWTNPESGLTYVAPSYLDGTGREQGMGASVLQHAIDLETAGDTAGLRSYVDTLDIVRRLTWRYGFGAQP